LSETTVPAGYDKVADITITVTPTYNTSTKPPTLTDLTCEPSNFTATVSNGTVEGKILNQPGSSLPSTGGMGTTLLYVAGAIMVLVAGVYLITKRRTNKESDR
jgi:LPXTG-motif cell wall-anchored protein